MHIENSEERNDNDYLIFFAPEVSILLRIGGNQYAARLAEMIDGLLSNSASQLDLYKAVSGWIFAEHNTYNLQ